MGSVTADPPSQALEDILDHCCFARNKLIDQPWRIVAIGLGDWAHASRSNRMLVFDRSGYDFRMA